MKKNLIWAAVFGLGVALLSGCASVPKQGLSEFQGTWVGHARNDPANECRMTITGNVLKCTSASQNQWYNCTLKVDATAQPRRADFLITDCSAPKYNQKTAKAIYRVEGKTLTIAANEPGTDNVPASFDGGDSLVIEFTRQ